jgi:hypothetical protein
VRPAARGIGWPAATNQDRVEESSRPFRIGGPATASWREHALARAAEYRFLARWLLREGDERSLEALRAIESHIDAAERAAAGKDTERASPRDGSGEDHQATLRGWAKLKSFVGGAAVERTHSQLDAVEADLLRLAPDPYLRGQLPNLVAHVENHLHPDDPRRRRLVAIASKVTGRPPEEELKSLEREEVVAAVRAASLEARREIRRVRSFRNVLLVSALILTLGVAGVTTLGVLSPERLAVCFVPDDEIVVCPTASTAVPQGSRPKEGEEAPSPQQQVDIDRLVRKTARSWDIPVLEIVGLLAAGLAGAFALRQIQGTSTPYGLPVAAAVLKLPTGALTAVLGLLLMRGGFVPGLSALDTSAQIIAWAIVFGYSQQLLTRFVDEQANTVLRNVDSPTNPQLEPPSDPQPAQTEQPA